MGERCAMTDIQTTPQPKWFEAYKFLYALVFAFSYQQAPLYSSNQNTYLLHSLAQAKIGFLKDDWLAKTVDPFPVFSALGSGTIQWVGEKFFYIEYIAVLAIFAYSILGIMALAWPVRRHRLQYILCSVAMIGLYSGVLTEVIQHAPYLNRYAIHFGPSGLLASGLANQSLLDPTFQPSVFAALIVYSIYAFTNKKPHVAAVALALAAAFHASYIISATLLTCIYSLILAQQRRNIRAGIWPAVIVALLLLPLVVYTRLNFGPSSAEASARAAAILVEFRIPHHALPQKWFNGVAAFQLILVALGIHTCKEPVIKKILIGISACAVLLTLVQLATGSYSIALLFPWRVSVFVVPISSAILISALISQMMPTIGQPSPTMKTAAMSMLTLASLFAIYLAIHRLERLVNQPLTGDAESYSFVTQSAVPGDIYLIPSDLQNFRVGAKVPVFVDFKSHPYKDVEVLEWYRRVILIDKIYAMKGDAACDALLTIRKSSKISHLVYPANKAVPQCGFLSETHHGKDIAIYKFEP